jgi:hypothetical protein
MKKHIIGKLGEYIVALELLKHSIDCVVIGGNNIKGTPDILCKDGIRIEVKTSIFVENGIKTNIDGIKVSGWGFAELKRSHCDYFALVLLENNQQLYKIIFIKKEAYISDTFIYRRPTQQDAIRLTHGQTRRETIRDYFITLDQFIIDNNL